MALHKLALLQSQINFNLDIISEQKVKLQFYDDQFAEAEQQWGPTSTQVFTEQHRRIQKKLLNELKEERTSLLRQIATFKNWNSFLHKHISRL